MDVTHLGHSCLLVEAAGARVLIDPGGFSDVSSVDGLDAVLVTHQHPDHLDPAQLDGTTGLFARNPEAAVHAEPATAAILRENGIEAADLTGRFAVGGVNVTPVGQRHALIHPYVPRIDNRGLVLSAEGAPTVFHPGDALDAEPGVAVDVLCVPVNAPWGKISETIEFVRRIAPARVVPIHDGLLAENGRAMYLGHIAGYGAEGGIEVLDLRGAGRTRL